jgi:hypothetical protein
VLQLVTLTNVLVIHLATASASQHDMCTIPLIHVILFNRKIVKTGCGIDQDFMELEETLYLLPLGEIPFQQGP